MTLISVEGPGNGKVGRDSAVVIRCTCAKLVPWVEGRVGVGRALSLCPCGSQRVSMFVDGLGVLQCDSLQGGSHILLGPGWYTVGPRVAWRAPTQPAIATSSDKPTILTFI